MGSLTDLTVFDIKADSSVGQAVASLTGLKKLDIRYDDFGDVDFSSWNRLSQLKELKLGNAELTDNSCPAFRCSQVWNHSTSNLRKRAMPPCAESEACRR